MYSIAEWNEEGEKRLESLREHLLGLRKVSDTKRFLAPDYDTGLHDPMLLPDIKPAVERFLTAVRKSERIAIISDYDADGIPGAVMMDDFLSMIGVTNYTIKIPHRHDDGYGLNDKMIDECIEEDTQLIITIDCGTSDSAEIAKATAAGIDVIVLDHHEVVRDLPVCTAVINPKRADSEYPFRELCGTGVAFKFVQAVLQTDRLGLKEGQEKWLLDMVGIATLSDMVPLVDENRVFAHYGLKVLRRTRRLGLQKFISRLNIPIGTISEDDIAFSITPKINAASRIADPHDAFLALSAKEHIVAQDAVVHLEKINDERKGMVAAIVRKIHKEAKQKDADLAVWVFGQPEWRPAIAGLIANSIAEEFGKTIFVWGRDGSGEIKGSCRSATHNIVDLMTKAEKSFVQFGGHEFAGGFTVDFDNVHTLEADLNEVAHLCGLDSESKKQVDAKLRVSDIHAGLANMLKQLSPFGVGNPKPLFLFEGVQLLRKDIFGKQKNHLKLILDAGERNIEAIEFFSKRKPEKIADIVSIVGHVEESYFGGRKSLRLRIVDIM